MPFSQGTWHISYLSVELSPDADAAFARQWLCVKCCAGEGLPWRLDGVGFEPEAVVEEAEVHQDFSGVDEECLDGVRFQFGSGAGAPAECSEAKGDGFKVVCPSGSFPCRDFEQE
jgi:hypothetical protein